MGFNMPWVYCFENVHFHGIFNGKCTSVLIDNTHLLHHHLGITTATGSSYATISIAVATRTGFCCCCICDTNLPSTNNSHAVVSTSRSSPTNHSGNTGIGRESTFKYNLDIFQATALCSTQTEADGTSVASSYNNTKSNNVRVVHGVGFADTNWVVPGQWAGQGGC